MNAGRIRWVQSMSRLFDITAVLLFLALPYAFRMLPAFIVLLAFAVIGLRVLEGGGQWRQWSWKSAMPWMVLFFVLHVLGMAWTTNTAFGRFDLEVKSSFFIFPLLGMLLPAKVTVNGNRIWRVFVWANVCAVCICMVAATWRFIDEWHLRSAGVLPAGAPWTNHFFESRFSLFLHPSYMALYLCFALALVQFSKGVEGKRMSWLAQLLLVIGVVLCNSKMGWLGLAVVMGIALWVGWRNRALRRRLIILALLGGTLFAGLFVAFPTVRGKVTQAISATGPIDPHSDQSSALRRMAWDAAWGLFREQPMAGVGTGDIKDELIASYQRKGYIHAAEKRMNAHSQFFQTAATLGILGLLCVLAIVVWPLINAVRNRGPLHVAFWLLILLNWSVESMGEVQAGVLFFVCVAWLLELSAADDWPKDGQVEQ